MSALPLGVLTCQDSAGPTPVYFHYQEQCCRAVVVCTAPSGILVCIPRGGVSPQEFEEAETSGYVGAIGPFSEVEVAVSNSRAKRTLAAIIFDLDIRGSAAIVERVPDGFPRESVVRFNIYRGAEDLPNRAALLELATNFINCGIGERRLEPYYSAHEDGAELEEAETVDQVPETLVPDGGGPEEEGASAMEVMLRRLLGQSEVTQRTLTGMHDRLSALESLEGRLSKLESGGPSCSASTSAQNFTPDVRWSRCNVGARTTPTSASFGRQRTRQVGRPRSSQSTHVSSSTQYG